jgi:hypothetical protein
MKSAFLAFAATMILGFAASAETPYARECRIAGGRQWSVSIQTEFDTTLCLFDSAAIGAEELAQYKWGNGLSYSLQTFMHQTTPRNPTGMCDVAGAAYWTATDTDGTRWELCKFLDGSVIELNTLAGGVNAPANAKLVHALK